MKFSGLLYRFLIVLSFLFFGCSRKEYRETLEICASINSPCIKGEHVVKIKTNKGSFLLKVDGNSAPVASGNFLDLVNKNIYNKTVFHTVIKEPYPFFMQVGDPLITKKTYGISKFKTGGFIDPKNNQIRNIPLEIKIRNEPYPRYGKVIRNISEVNKVELKHLKGSVSMARFEDINSASSQFFITLKALPELDGRYTVFGRIISGMDVLDLINEGDYIIEAKVL